MDGLKSCVPRIMVSDPRYGEVLVSWGFDVIPHDKLDSMPTIIIPIFGEGVRGGS